MYTYYEERGTPAQFVAVRVGMVICGASRKTVEALKARLRRRILELVEDRPGEERTGDETP